MKKRWISFFLIGLLLTSLLSACGSKVDMSFPKTEQQLKATSVRNGDDDQTKILVAFYSSSGTTEAVAKQIAEATGGDLFQLIPTEPYSSDDLNYNDKTSRISKEYASSDLRDIELEYNSVDDWDSYDTVFIGYPIWWGNAAWPINSFLQLNDFDGKTVIPFCTSASSGIEDSEDFVKTQAAGGTWEEGKRFSSGFSAEQVTEWVAELSLAK